MKYSTSTPVFRQELGVYNGKYRGVIYFRCGKERVEERDKSTRSTTTTTTTTMSWYIFFGLDSQKKEDCDITPSSK